MSGGPTLVQVPYDSGRFGERLGRGPLHLIEHGLLDRLAEGGLDTELVEVRLDRGHPTQAASAAALQRRIRAAVREASAAGRFPVVLSGNCAAAALGVTSAFAAGSTGVVWFDAHGDFNTPETSPSGFFDGMALSVLTGNSWPELAASMDGFAPTPESQVLMIGARDLDEAERRLLELSAVARLPVEALRADVVAARRALTDLAARAAHLYLHVDLDVLDPESLTANGYAAPGGLTLDELLAALAAAREAAPIAALAITAYDPTADPENRGLDAALRVIIATLGA